MEWMRRELERMRNQASGAGPLVLEDGSRYYYDVDRVLGEVVHHAAECARCDYFREPRPAAVPEIFEKIAQARDRRRAIMALWPDAFDRPNETRPGPFVGVDLIVLEAEGRLVLRWFAPSYEPVAAV
jgi:hypothetical protein